MKRLNYNAIFRMAQQEGYVSSAEEFHSMREHMANLSASPEDVADIAFTGDDLQRSRQDLFAACRGEGKAKEEARGKYMQDFAVALQKMREENPRAISLAECVRAMYNMSLYEFMNTTFGIKKSDTIRTAIQKMGGGDVVVKDVADMLHTYSGGQLNFNSTRDFATQKWLIPEFFLTVVDLGYKGGAKHIAWIAGVETVTSRDVTLPFIKEGDLMPHEIAEGANIPLGEMDFGSKKVRMKKVGIGIRLTEELVSEASLNMMSLFLALAGNRMARGADNYAVQVLVSGDQADLSDSAPVIGVDDTAAGHTQFDLANGQTALTALGYTPTKLVAPRLDTLRDLNKSTPTREYISMRDYAAKLGMETDTWGLTAGQVLLLDPTSAMVKTSMGGMRILQEQDAKNGNYYMYASEYLGFAIMVRAARIVVDSDLAYSAHPLPAYMDVEAALAKGYQS